MGSFFRPDPQWKRVAAVALAGIAIVMATRFISNALVADIVIALVAAGLLLFVRARYRRSDEPPATRDGATRRRRR